jgi:hypothetical protein
MMKSDEDSRDVLMQLDSSKNFRPPSNTQAPWHNPYVGSKKLPPPQYKVPNLGVDHDVIGT